MLSNRHHAVAGLNNIASTLHEAAHQLCFNSGLLSRRVKHPFWVSEGFATAFETTHPALEFGPGHDNRSRMKALDEAARRGTLVPLVQFIGVTDMSGTAITDQGDAYAQSWGMLTWLYRTRLEQLQTYIARLNAGADATEAFKQTIGDPASLEAEWRKFVTELR
jgi:hypothetical protein